MKFIHRRNKGIGRRKNRNLKIKAYKKGMRREVVDWKEKEYRKEG